MKDILKNIPDKREDKNTTSLKFKKDLISYLGDDYKDKVCLEIGTSRGYSTKILSHLFKKVITCENNIDTINFAKNVNKDRNNIEFLHKDVYNTAWDFEGVDVVFIDCNHEISYVLSDIRNAINLCEKNDDILIIFDDYGLDNPWEGVKEAIATYDDDDRFEIVREIGEPKGSDCNPRALLRDVEGVICKFKSKVEYKNLVFIMDIQLDGDGRYSSNRSSHYKYSIGSWKKWCEKNNSELFVLNDLVLPNEEMGICWQRYYLFDILASNDVKYDQVLMVDADTIVHPDCPNFFDMSNGKYVGVHNEGSYDWIFRSLEHYSKYIFGGKTIEWWKYINGGFQIVNHNHKKFFENVVNFYWTYNKNLIELQNTFHTGTDQTPLNYLIHLNNVNLKLLPYEFNMCDLNRKEILTEDMLFTKVGWVYQFNSIPNQVDHNITNHYLEKTYKHFYGELK